jgi:very-short-patch-repair endonuclease
MDWKGPAEVFCPTSGKRRAEQRDPDHFAPAVVRKADRLDPRDVTMADGIPVTTVARTLVDLSAVLSERQLASVLDSSGIKKLLDLEDLKRVVGASRGRKGIGKLRSLLERWHPSTVLTRSELEARFLRFLKKIGFDEPMVNSTVADCEVDFYWPEYDMVVELDGRAFHDTGRGFEEDRERNFRLEMAGKKILRLTWDMVVNRPTATAIKLFEYRKMALMTKLDLDHCDAERDRLHESIAAENPGWERGEALWSRGPSG